MLHPSLLKSARSMVITCWQAASDRQRVSEAARSRVALPPLISSLRSELRYARLGSLFGGAHLNNLEIHQVTPVIRPLLQHAHVRGFHDLKATAKLEVDPA